MSRAKKAQISVKPIGWVRNEVKEPKRRQWDEVVSELVLNPELTEATEGLEEFSHVVVLFWMHQVPVEARSQTKVHPQRRADLPLVGVLVTRSPARPNPIGMAVVRLLERKGNVLKVKGLDAIDGTPLLDIKPCFPGDAITQVQVPEWVNKLTSSGLLELQPISTGQRLKEIYHALLCHYGRQHWWPADEPFEVIVGAILTQTTTWQNVEKAISNLKQAGALNSAVLRQLPLDQLAELVYPCGYYRAKALKLKAFAEHLAGYDDSLQKLFALDIGQLREELISIYGIGEETADSIILYAAKKPVFVIDAYTRRILRRLGLAPARDDYAAFQELFMDNLPRDQGLYNEYHALLVRHGKEACRKRPRCAGCCLSPLCSFSR